MTYVRVDDIPEHVENHGRVEGTIDKQSTAASY